MFAKLLTGWYFPLTEIIVYGMLILSILYLWQYRDPKGNTDIDPLYPIMIIYLVILAEVFDWYDSLQLMAYFYALDHGYYPNLIYIISWFLTSIYMIAFLTGFLLLVLKVYVDAHEFYEKYSSEYPFDYLNMPLLNLTIKLLISIRWSIIHMSVTQFLIYYIIIVELYNNPIGYLVKIFLLLNFFMFMTLGHVLYLLIQIELMLSVLEYRLLKLWEDYQEPPFYILLLRKYPTLFFKLIINSLLLCMMLAYGYLCFTYPFIIFGR